MRQASFSPGKKIRTGACCLDKDWDGAKESEIDCTALQRTVVKVWMKEQLKVRERTTAWKLKHHDENKTINN